MCASEFIVDIEIPLAPQSGNVSFVYEEWYSEAQDVAENC